ncbi:hypothetical protein CfE428DRAFT_3554 [Chthoniobacter flavus Ellin428]|uniref:Glycosyl hydrolase-like 10 domain-containing protein n=2 Tax=Chthoniobacter flavus TaxID=191863 RepID=B4D3R6_9BACT|nr:hypothetical protein [Chthoniobacter flavus]EDY18896.1 hypothetical protein CfE428DRAFT_3554 [Chthoniobacter flavus Ellin428]TCO93486.1 hypothetical protein EV701_104190 [Chthoniobacter flavus]
MDRRCFLATGVGAWLTRSWLRGAEPEPVVLPDDHQAAVRQRRRRIVMQYDANDVVMSYWKLHPDGRAAFEPFREALFAYVDEPGSQVDAIWWDIEGSPLGSAYPSKVLLPVDDPLVRQWLDAGIDWVEQLVAETRRRKREVFWNHRICEVEFVPGVGHSKTPHPLKVQHPDWVVAADWWPHGTWNLAAEGLRAYKVAILRELTTRYDFDGLQIDFSRHIPCLPVGRQWELRESVTEFLREVRRMTLEVAAQRGRPLLLAAKVPQTIDGCHADGFDVRAWAEQRLVDILTLGSRTMDVDVEGVRAAVGKDVQLQPCFDDHHATDGYRHGPIEFLRGVFANHWQRGANSVVTFNWSIGTPEVCRAMGSEVAPLAQGEAYREVGDLATMAGKDKFFAVERRGGYPWAQGFFNRNDTAPLPKRLEQGETPVRFTVHIADTPASKSSLLLRCVLFQAEENDSFVARLNGVNLSLITRDPEWKDAQIFSPKPQPNSGGAGEYRINPQQKLLRLDFAVPVEAWKQGANVAEVQLASRKPESGKTGVQLEKLEAHLHYG